MEATDGAERREGMRRDFWGPRDGLVDDERGCDLAEAVFSFIIVVN